MPDSGPPRRRAAGTLDRSGGRRSSADGRRARGAWREGIDLPRHAFPFLVAWAALLLLAPPVHNGFWGLNGFRSLGTDARIGLLLAAAATPLLLQVRSRQLATALGVVLALVLAFPLRESIHFLGDTQVRARAMAIFNARMITEPISEWSTRVHANPLDILVDFLLPVGLRRLGLSGAQAVSLVSVTLALTYLAGLWRVAGRLGVAPGLRPALCAALAIAGTLEAYAGYAESVGLLLAAAAWWWAEMLVPLDRPRQALRTVGAWLLMALCHRLAFVMLAPLAWRAFGPVLEGDRPEVRRRLLVLGVPAVAIALAAMRVGGTGKVMGEDFRDMGVALFTMARAVPVSDYLNAIMLAAPLAWLAPWLAGRAALTTYLRQRSTMALVIGGALGVPITWMVLANRNGLGAHRDWDLAALAGLTLTINGAALLASLPAARLRGALLCALPLLVLHAGGWILVNADAQAALARAKELTENARLPDTHAAHLHNWLGQRAMDLGEPAFAAPELEKSYELNGNPRRALLAAEAWAMAGNIARARTMIALAKAGGTASPAVSAALRRLDSMVEQLAADSVARMQATPGAGP